MWIISNKITFEKKKFSTKIRKKLKGWKREIMKDLIIQGSIEGR